jgi:orotate phosphoribosyltransferase
LDQKLVLRRGFKIPESSNVLIVEDVITTGKSALECSELIEASKSKLIGYACIIDRSNSKSLIKDKIVSQIKLKMDTYKNKELPDDLKKIQPTKLGSRNL